MIEQGEADFVVDIASELPLQAIAEIMGVPQEDRMRLFEWSNRMIGAGDPEYMGEEAGSAMVEIFAYSNQLAEKRRDDPRDDIVTKLLNAEIDGDKLSELEFDMFMLLLAVAGNETTRNATAHGMHALLTNPDQYKILTDDPDGAIGPATEEILRWASPVLHFKRTVTADTEIRGQEIKEGDAIVMWYISANRDEEVFDDPYTLRRDARPEPADRVRRRRQPLLPRREPRTDGAAAHLPGGREAHARHAARRRASTGSGRTSSAASSTCR